MRVAQACTRAEPRSQPGPACFTGLCAQAVSVMSGSFPLPSGPGISRPRQEGLGSGLPGLHDPAGMGGGAEKGQGGLPPGARPSRVRTVASGQGSGRPPLSADGATGGNQLGSREQPRGLAQPDRTAALAPGWPRARWRSVGWGGGAGRSARPGLRVLTSGRGVPTLPVASPPPPGPPPLLGPVGGTGEAGVGRGLPRRPPGRHSSGSGLLVREEDPPVLVGLQGGRRCWSPGPLDRGRPGTACRLQTGAPAQGRPHGAPNPASSPRFWRKGLSLVAEGRKGSPRAGVRPGRYPGGGGRVGVSVAPTGTREGEGLYRGGGSCHGIPRGPAHRQGLRSRESQGPALGDLGPRICGVGVGGTAPNLRLSGAETPAVAWTGQPGL